jgi:hypothetical protein
MGDVGDAAGFTLVALSVAAIVVLLLVTLI